MLGFDPREMARLHPMLSMPMNEDLPVCLHPPLTCADDAMDAWGWELITVHLF